MKKTYDLVFGLGTACSCTQTIRAAGLQFESFPYDWVAHEPAERDLGLRIEAIENEFRHWFDKEDLCFFGSFDFGWHARDMYHNRRNGGLFHHDFNVGEDLDSAYPAVWAKYRRRIDGLFRRIRASRRVLVVRLDFVGQKVPTSVESCVQARQRLMAKFPGVTFDWLLMAHDAAFTMDNPKDELVSEGVRRVAFDCHSDNPGDPSYQPDLAKTSAVLSRYASAVDYRTPAEKRHFRELKRREHWAKYGATTFWGYLWAKLTGKKSK